MIAKLKRVDWKAHFGWNFWFAYFSVYIAWGYIKDGSSVRALLMILAALRFAQDNGKHIAEKKAERRIRETKPEAA